MCHRFLALCLAVLLVACGGAAQTEAATPSTTMPTIPKLASFEGLVVYVDSSLAATQYRPEVVNALLEAGVRVVDEQTQEHDLALALNPMNPAMAVSTGFGTTIEFNYGLKATLTRDGKMVDTFSVSMHQKGDAASVMQQANEAFTWLGRKLVEELVTSSKAVAIAEQVTGKTGNAVASAAPGAGGLIAATPQAAAYAFIVGIEAYRDLPSPDGARADAEAFAQMVKTTLGLPDERVRVALDDRATAADMRRGVKWLVDNVPAGGRAYFYFSGHGAPDPSTGTSYLVPYDGDPNALVESAVGLKPLIDTLASAQAKETLAVIDSCFSGSGGRSVLPKGTRPLVRVKRAAVPKTVALLTAATGAEISGAAADGRQGLFTRHLVDALGRGRADMDGDAQISLQELLDWVKPRVSRDAKAAGRQQNPSLIVGNAVGDRFIVAHGIATP